MLVDFNQELKTIFGKPLKENIPDDEGEGVKTINATLKSVSVNALLGNEKDCDGKEKASRYFLAMQIQKSEEPLELDVSDVAKIKKLVGKAYPPLVVGQVTELLDPPKEKKA